MARMGYLVGKLAYALVRRKPLHERGRSRLHCLVLRSLLRMPTGKLHIVPLGGLGEFGMNCMAVRWGNDIIVIDAGLMFPEAELLGVDIVVPDIAGWRRERLTPFPQTA